MLKSYSQLCSLRIERCACCRKQLTPQGAKRLVVGENNKPQWVCTIHEVGKYTVNGKTVWRLK